MLKSTVIRSQHWYYNETLRHKFEIKRKQITFFFEKRNPNFRIRNLSLFVQSTVLL